MSKPEEPTYTGGAHTLKEAFEHAKGIAEDHEVGMCFLDPNGIGVPTMIVLEGDGWKEWAKDPRLIDQSGVIAVDPNTIDWAPLVKALIDEDSFPSGLSTRS